jgi:hypothetical protein
MQALVGASLRRHKASDEQSRRAQKPPLGRIRKRLKIAGKLAFNLGVSAKSILHV